MIEIKTKWGILDRAEDICFQVRTGTSLARGYGFKPNPDSTPAALLRGAQDFLYFKGFDWAKSIRMLNAHGNSNGGTFRYVHYPKDRLRWGKVEDWIEEHDRNYDALVIVSCNTAGVELQSRNAVLMYPQGEIADFHVSNAQRTHFELKNGGCITKEPIGESQFKIFVPRIFDFYLNPNRQTSQKR